MKKPLETKKPAEKSGGKIRPSTHHQQPPPTQPQQTPKTTPNTTMEALLKLRTPDDSDMLFSENATLAQESFLDWMRSRHSNQPQPPQRTNPTEIVTPTPTPPAPPEPQKTNLQTTMETLLQIRNTPASELLFNPNATLAKESFLEWLERRHEHTPPPPIPLPPKPSDSYISLTMDIIDIATRIMNMTNKPHDPTPRQPTTPTDRPAQTPTPP